jgi:hypothetical protein
MIWSGLLFGEENGIKNGKHKENKKIIREILIGAITRKLTI